MKKLFGSATMLAGGRGLRMGRDKELISANTTRILGVLQQGFEQVIVSTKNPALYDIRQITAVSDILPDCGPLGGIFTALCLSRSQYLFVQPCDMPNISGGMIAYMQQQTEEKKPLICIAASARGPEPLIGFYSASLLEEMRDYLLGGGRKLQTFLEGKDCLIIEQEQLDSHIDDDTFANLNAVPTESAGKSEAMICSLPAKRFSLTGITPLEEMVVRECRTDLYYNGILRDKLIHSPQFERELCFGRLRSLGLINTASDIDSLICSDGLCLAYGAERIAKEPTVISDKLFSARRLIELSSQFLSRSEVFDKTGGVHSGAVSDGESLLCFFEDIGRYNVADKCIGHALLNAVDMPSSALFTSGRVACELVLKAAEAGFALIVSRAAPTDMAVHLADELGIGLIAFARNGRFNIYCHEEMICE